MNSTTNEAPLCVWSEAGVVAHRLCNRRFSCELCPLDAALRNCAQDFDSTADEMTSCIISIPLPEELNGVQLPFTTALTHVQLCNECRYTSRHLWVRRNHAGLVWCGFDALADTLLPEDATIVTRALNSAVHIGEPFAWVYTDGATLALPSPVTGTLVDRKERATRGVAHNPYADAAIACFLPDPRHSIAASTESAIDHASALRQDARKALMAIRRSVARGGVAETGFCLNDGGEAVSDLRSMLGGEHWLRLVRELLSGE